MILSSHKKNNHKGTVIGLFVISAIVLVGALVWFLDLNKKPTPTLLADSSAQTHIPVEEWTTEKGLHVLFVSAPALPMIDIRLIFDAGSARDGDLSGLAQLTSQVLTQGSADFDSQAIAARIDSVGAKLSTTVNRDTTIISFRSLLEPKLFDTAFSTLLSVIGKPIFPEDAFLREQQRLLSTLREQEQLPNVEASQSFYATVYGNHPYAQPVMGKPETVNKVIVSDLQNFATQHYTQENAVLAIVGDVTLEEAKKLANQIESALPAGAPLEALTEPKAPATKAEINIPFPSTQTHILLGGLSIRRDDPDFFPLFLGNHILGGSGLVSILFHEVRVKNGFAYSAGSSLSPLHQTGTFIITAQTRNEAAADAIAVIEETLTHFVTNGPTEEQLQASQSNITGNFALQLDSNAALVDTLAAMAFYKLPLDYLATYRAHILAVTPEQVRDALQKHINLEDITLVTVGNNLS